MMVKLWFLLAEVLLVTEGMHLVQSGNNTFGAMILSLAVVIGYAEGRITTEKSIH